MRQRISLFLMLLALNAGCSNDRSQPVGPGAAGGGAVIVGKIVSADQRSKTLAGCTDAIVTLNGVPADVEFDDNCEFVVTGVVPSQVLTLRVDLPLLGVSGTVEIRDVTAGELIEIEVEASEEQLSIDIVRRAAVDSADFLPTVVASNNVHIRLGRGVHVQDLTVRGNNFVLVGEAGEDCLDSGWTVIEGDVLVMGHNATFRDIAFAGDVRISGNDARFINCCFDGDLVRFGHGRGSNDDFDDDDFDDDDHEEDDD